MESLKANAGKIGFVAVLILAAIVIMWMQGGNKPTRSGSVQYVCVSTGKVFWLPRKPRIPPVENPDSGQKTLLPCHEQEDGTVVVSDRVRSLVKQFDKDGINQYVDSKTLVVRAAQ